MAGSWAAVGEFWDPDVAGWEHSWEPERRVKLFAPVGEYRTRYTLDLGDMPDRARVRVAINSDTLAVTCSSGRYSELEIAGGIRSLELAGPFRHVAVTTASPGGTTITCQMAPIQLQLGSGAWNLGGKRAAGDQLRVRLAGGNVDVTGGDIASIEGTADRLNIGSPPHSRPTMNVTGMVTTAHQTHLTSLRCELLRVNGNLDVDGDIVVTGANVVGPALSASDIGVVRCHRLDVTGDVAIQQITAVEAAIHGNTMGYSHYAPAELASLDTFQPADDLSLTPPIPRRPGCSIQATALTVTGSLIAETVASASDELTVNCTRMLWIQRLHTEATGTVTASILVAASVAAPNVDLTANHADLQTAVTARSVTAAHTLRSTAGIDAATVRAAHAVVGGKINVARLDITDSFHATQTADVAGETHVSGSGSTERGSYLESLTWSPADSGESALSLFGVAAELTVCSTRTTRSADTPALLTGDGTRPLSSELTVSGWLSVRPTAPTSTGGKHEWTIDRLVIDGHDANITLDGSMGLEIHAIDIQILVDTRAELCLIGPHQSLVFSTATTVAVVPPVGGATLTFTGEGRNRLTLGGSGAVEVHGEIDSLIVISDQVLLEVADDAIVTRAVGDIRLQRIDGSIYGSTSGADTTRLISLGTVGRDAQLVAVDVTQLPGADISKLRDADVIEPLTGPLIEHAKEQVDERELRRRSQQILNLHTALQSKAVSGRTRMAVAWAAARLHHRTTGSGHRKRSIETGTRWFHRMLGYGHHPGPPAAIWLASSFVVTFFSRAETKWGGFCDRAALTGNGNQTVSLCAESFGDVGREFLRTALFPFRLTNLNPEYPVFSFLVDWQRPFAGIAVGFPFLLTLLAMRRFFTLSHDRS